MEISTIGDLLHWSYANLAMAHAAVTEQAVRYGQSHFMIRSRLYAGLQRGTMQTGSMLEDERLKMILPQACCYCGNRESLSVDHLIPQSRGGGHAGENLVWACRSCNSSKGARDVLEWLKERGEFPALLLLRRYLKLALQLGRDQNFLTMPIADAPPVPFALAAIPRTYPTPDRLRLWVISLG